jgi:hypothetical protein
VRSNKRVSFSFRFKSWSSIVLLGHYKECARTDALKECEKLRAKAGKR